MATVPLTFTSFTAETLTTATTDEDLSTIDGININQTVTLTATDGDADAQAAIDGQSATISAISDAHTLQLMLDLSTQDVTGLTATGELQTDDVDPPAPPPMPDHGPNHIMASMSPGVTTIWHPSPGVGGLPVAPNPDDTATGTYKAEQSVPDPQAPTVQTISNADALAKTTAARDDMVQKIAAQAATAPMAAPAPGPDYSLNGIYRPDPDYDSDTDANTHNPPAPAGATVMTPDQPAPELRPEPVTPEN